MYVYLFLWQVDDSAKHNAVCFQKVDSDTQHSGQHKKQESQGSYKKRFRKLAGLEPLSTVQKPVQQQQQPQVVTKQQRTLIAERRGDIITKSGLNRMLNIRI